MRHAIWVFLWVVLLSTQPSSAVDNTARVRGGVHPGFFRVVLEGPADLVRSIDLGSSGGEKREVRISLSDGTEVTLPPADTWKAGPVRSVRMEGDTLVFAVDPTAPIESRRLHDPDRYVFDFVMSSTPGSYDAGESAGLTGPGVSPVTGGERESGGQELPVPAVPARAGAVRKPRAVLSPEQQAARIRGVRRVVIDPGHGGYDEGLPGEKEFTLRLARRLERALGTAGIRTQLTRIGNSFVSIGERIRQIEEFDPDVYLSLHMSEKYFRVYTGGAGSASREALGLRTRLQTDIATVFGDDALGEAVAPVALTAELPFPGALVEIPRGLDAGGEEALGTVAGVLLGVLGKGEEDEPQEPARRGWW